MLNKRTAPAPHLETLHTNMENAIPAAAHFYNHRWVRTEKRAVCEDQIGYGTCALQKKMQELTSDERFLCAGHWHPGVGIHVDISPGTENRKLASESYSTPSSATQLRATQVICDKSRLLLTNGGRLRAV